MSRYVIDASAAEYLLRTSLGLKIAEIIEGSLPLAPELLDVEVLSVFRRAVLRRELKEERALRAIDDLMDWPIDRIPQIARLDSLATPQQCDRVRRVLCRPNPPV